MHFFAFFEHCAPISYYVYHFLLNLDTFLIKLETLPRRFDAFEIKLNFQIKTSLVQIKLGTLQEGLCDFLRRKIYYDLDFLNSPVSVSEHTVRNFIKLPPFEENNDERLVLKCKKVAVFRVLKEAPYALPPPPPHCTLTQTCCVPKRRVPLIFLAF